MDEAAQIVCDIQRARGRVFTRGDVWKIRLVKQYGVGEKASEEKNKDLNLGNEIFKIRRCVILQWDSPKMKSVVVVPIMSAFNDKDEPRKPMRSWIKLEAGDGGTDRESYILCEEIRSVDKARILEYSGKITHPKMQKVQQILFELLFSKLSPRKD